MLDGVYLTLVFASNDESVNSLALKLLKLSLLAAEISTISAANEFSDSSFEAKTSVR